MKWTIAAVLAVSVGAAAWGQEPASQPAENAQVRDWRYVLSIHEIARADDDARLSKLLGDNPDRARNRDAAEERTPVHVASEVGALKSLRILARAGADLNVKDKKGRTPLTIAVGLDYATTVKTLLELGADVSQEGLAEGAVSGESAGTPVSIAARRGYAGVMKMLLDAKPDLNRRDADGTLPLTRASQNRQWATMKLLLDHGADANAKDASQLTVLHHAVVAEDLDAVKTVLAAKGDANLASGDKTTPLWHAVKARKLEIARALLDAKADPNVRVESDAGATPLLQAAKNNDTKMVTLLLERGADPKIADARGLAPIAASTSPEIWRMLADKGADVNVMVGEATRLQHYISQGNVEALKAWLKFEPNPLAPDKHGQTAKELARAFADRPTGTYEGDAARKEIAMVMTDYQQKAWEKREATRKPASSKPAASKPAGSRPTATGAIGSATQKIIRSCECGL